MLHLIRRNLAIVLSGALLVVGASYVGAQTSQTQAPAEIELAQAEPGEPGEPGPRGPRSDDGRRHKGPRGFMHHAIRGEFVTPMPDAEGEFQTVNLDRGELAAIEGTTLAIDEADGFTARIETNDDTEFVRDGEAATLDDLQVGDKVMAHRVDGVTKHVHAMSPEAQTEREGAERQRLERRLSQLDPAAA